MALNIGGVKNVILRKVISLEKFAIKCVGKTKDNESVLPGLQRKNTFLLFSELHET